MHSMVRQKLLAGLINNISFVCVFQIHCVTYYAALLPRRGRILRRTLSVCLSVRLSVCLSVRPVLVYIRTSVTCFRQPCRRVVSFVLFTCQGRI